MISEFSIQLLIYPAQLQYTDKKWNKFKAKVHFCMHGDGKVRQ